MFFRREKPRVLSFDDHLDQLRAAGYTVTSNAQGSRVRKGGFAAELKEGASGDVLVAEAGLALGDEIAELTDIGFQKIFMTPSGHKTPALAEHLHGLHNFTEDLRETLGLTSLYNEGLGTTNEKHLYDRVTKRDAAAQPRPWQR